MEVGEGSGGGGGMGTVRLFLPLFISREVEPRLPIGLWAPGASLRFPGGLSGPLATGCPTLDGDSGPCQPKGWGLSSSRARPLLQQLNQSLGIS